MEKTKVDVLVWIDSDGDPVCSAQSKEGLDFIRTFVPRMAPNDVVVISSPPEVFENHVPPNITVGYVNPETNKVTRLHRTRLH